MSNDVDKEPNRKGYGNIYTPHAGSMIIQIQRESGLANRTIILTQRQVRLLRRGSYVVGGALVIVLLSWFYLATQAVRVPLLNQRVKTLQHDVRRLDTLQAALTQLEGRFQQVQKMLGVASPSQATTATVSSTKEDSNKPPKDTAAPLSR